jgi:hypothetical protein
MEPQHGNTGGLKKNRLERPLASWIHHEEDEATPLDCGREGEKTLQVAVPSAGRPGIPLAPR